MSCTAYLLCRLSFSTAGWWTPQLVYPRVIQLALSLTSSPHIASDIEPLLIVILILLLSAEIGGPPAHSPSRNCWHPERSSEYLRAACSITAYSRALHCYFLYPLWLYFVMSVIKKQLCLYRDTMPLMSCNYFAGSFPLLSIAYPMITYTRSATCL